MSTIGIVTIVILSLILLLFVGYFLSTYICYALSIRRDGLVGKHIKNVFKKDAKLYGIDTEFWKNQNFEKFEIENNGDKLYGFYIKNPKVDTNKLAIVIHGYYSNHEDMTIQSKIFLDLGFNVFCPDCKSHGESKGKTIGMGYFEKNDLKKWVEFLIAKFGESTQIAIFGWSMGAAIANLYAGENTCSNVKCVISDCSYTNAYYEFKAILKQYKALVQPTLFLLNQGAKMYGEFNLKDVDVEKAVKNSNVPILFIHGEKDTLVPCYMSERLYNVKVKSDKKLEIFKNAEHCMSYASDKDRYINIIKNFINTYFV